MKLLANYYEASHSLTHMQLLSNPHAAFDESIHIAYVKSIHSFRLIKVWYLFPVGLGFQTNVTQIFFGQTKNMLRLCVTSHVSCVTCPQRQQTTATDPPPDNSPIIHSRVVRPDIFFGFCNNSKMFLGFHILAIHSQFRVLADGTNRTTDIPTSRLNRPRGRFSPRSKAKSLLTKL